LWVNVRAHGKSAHGAYPWKADNPVWRINRFLNELVEAFPTPKVQTSDTTVSVTNILTDNKAQNKMPTTCDVMLDIRYSPYANERDLVLSKLASLIGSNMKMQIVFEEPPMDTPADNLQVHKLQQAAGKHLNRKINLYCANGTSDVSHYGQIGCPGVEFGPVGQVGNTHNEYVEIQSLEQYYYILVDFLMSLKFQ
jgi:succinyl-diaminopimelate desuccinylase